ncbi:MAG: hypothetical protein LC744_02840 [Chloroflexi bacterium]|nr:hypothetical protein [Chloroflexota bacterium]
MLEIHSSLERLDVAQARFALYADRNRAVEPTIPRAPVAGDRHSGLVDNGPRRWQPLVEALEARDVR